MAYPANQQPTFPAVPHSPSAGDYEMRDNNDQQDASRPSINQTPYLKPYLGLRARLSQILINRWTILLLLVLIRLLFAIGSTDTNLTSARAKALQACTEIETIGSKMASVPHYMSQGVNEMTATSVEKAVNGLQTVMDLSVTGVEEVVLFVIHMMTSTYLCLITLAVRGSVGAAVEIGNEISKGLNDTINSVTDDMGDATKTVTDGINSLLSKLNNIPFTPGFEKPSIDLTSQIDKLKALEVPPELQEGLQKLNNSIPTFDEVQNFTDNVIRLPFEEVKKLIAGMGNFTFDRQLLPVPQMEQLTFCSDGNDINSFFDKLAALVSKTKKMGIAILIVMAILVCVPMAWAEVRRYRRTQDTVKLLGKDHDGMDVVYMASRPHSARIGLWLSRIFGSGRRQAIIRWTYAYATSTNMMLLLAVALGILFSCFCQYLLVRAMQKEVPDLTEQVANFTEQVVSKLNNASMSWGDGIDSATGKLNETINEDILGWVNTTTTAVNGTLNTFVDKMSTTLHDAFGGTPLEDPIKDVLNCLVGLKIASFQKGLTWVQDHAHVDFPKAPRDMFSLKALADKSNSSTAAELFSDPGGKATDEVTDAVNHVVNFLLAGIRQEAILAGIVMLVWAIYMIGGVIFAVVQISRRGADYGSDNAYIINPVLHQDANAEAEKNVGYPTVAPPQYEYPVNKAAPYTLQPNPRPFATFPPADSDTQSENFGQVGSHPVAESARPGHLRASSHGALADPSPINEKADPFRDPENPFGDNQYPRNEKR